MNVCTSGWNTQRFCELNREDMLEMGIAEGDAVYVRSRSVVPLLAKLGNPHKIKKGTVGLGIALQKKISASAGDDVSVAKAEYREAVSVKVVTGIGGLPEDNLSYMIKKREQDNSQVAELAKAALMNTPARRGDVLSSQTLLDEELDMPLDMLTVQELFRALQKQEVFFRIVETNPSGLVLITPKTQIIESDAKDLALANSKISFEAIGGLANVKGELRQFLEFPLKNAKAFEALKIRPTMGVVLHGPPGCGKTMLAKAVAYEIGAEVIYIRGAELYNCFFGESEKQVRKLFQYARAIGNCVIIMDEFDAIAGRRNTAGHNSRLFDTVLSTLLAEMDGMDSNSGVVVVACTNRLDNLDPALLRPGRFDHIIKIALPDTGARREILDIYLKGKPAAEELPLEETAKRTSGHTGADLENLIRRAVMEAAKECPEEPKLAARHLRSALESAKPSLTEDEIKYYTAEKDARGKDGKNPMFG